jgi:RimJ/RimL family protein N-acetyltransferase
MSELASWTTRPPPERRALDGHYVVLQPLDPRVHGDQLFEAGSGPEADGLWRYLWDGPFSDRVPFDAWLTQAASTIDPLFFAIRDKASDRVEGRLAFLRVDGANGVIETGHILFGPRLARTPGATEAVYLQARYVFDELGYRRFEWKCDNANERSRRAALRFGFMFEGVFRQHMIVKGRNRDTAWFSMLDREWPARKAGFESWLSPDNFDENGRQRKTLSAFRHVASASPYGA